MNKRKYISPMLDVITLEQMTAKERSIYFTLKKVYPPQRIERKDK